ncbi:MAG: molybdopterin molybdotransferase MoeA [Chloroflexi bacterium]|nr:molybdopterin molybdotransferase MoeA [Chloroflexota bacterium]
MSNLISVDDALARILAHIRPLPPERVPLLDALDRVLTENLIADSNIPPFDNSAMDGYAVIAADTQLAQSTLRIIGEVAAGSTDSGVTVERGTAVRIMTGAPIPVGADAVVRFEQTNEQTLPAPPLNPTSIKVLAPVSVGDNVRHAGEDVACGSVVLGVGTLIRPQEIGMCAALGHARVSVHRKPRVAILSTGDELVGLDELLSPGKIRNVNEHATAAQVLRYGGVPICLGIARDRIEHLTAKVEEGLAQQPDLFVTSAGVSVGDFDMVKDVLAGKGKMEFWSVNMKPGKPMAFGHIRGVPLVGLPGNPVAALIAFEQFVRPVLLKMAGRTACHKPTLRAVLDEDVENSGRRHFVRAVVEHCADAYHVRSSGEQGSGVLSSLLRANALLLVPEGVSRLERGSWVDVQMLDWNEAYF